MKKDHVRDYATEAFRFYKKTGMTAEQYKKKLHKEAYDKAHKEVMRDKNKINKPTEMALIIAEEAVENKEAEIRDIQAVEATLDLISRMKNSNEILKAIECVYFTDADKPVERNDISNRIYKAIMSIPSSERCIYRSLGKARQMFAIERGLRIY